jgi:hypothetical protein
MILPSALATMTEFVLISSATLTRKDLGCTLVLLDRVDPSDPPAYAGQRLQQAELAHPAPSRFDLFVEIPGGDRHQPPPWHRPKGA